ncbi:uncharacterized protein [Centruroides vittatus]|uniref:uncharacterized protein n=1 Tax=Centruroides vittatus TaxID=120091 RepID=UPI00350F1FE3
MIPKRNKEKSDVSDTMISPYFILFFLINVLPSRCSKSEEETYVIIQIPYRMLKRLNSKSITIQVPDTPKNSPEEPSKGASSSDYSLLKNKENQEEKETEAEPDDKKTNKHFSYLNVYGPEVYEFGYRQGNSGHFMERKEARKGPTSRVAVRWGDHKSGYGEHYWDFNHGEKENKDD